MLSDRMACTQVACFTATTVGAEMALAALLPIGRTQADSEQLLQQTAEAGGVRLRFVRGL